MKVKILYDFSIIIINNIIIKYNKLRLKYSLKKMY